MQNWKHGNNRNDISMISTTDLNGKIMEANDTNIVLLVCNISLQSCS